MSQQPHEERLAPHATARYLLVFASLTVLTLLTLGMAYIDLGGANGAVAVVIAAAKATLVLLFFMHVRTSSPLIRATIGAACLWLGILLSLTLLDFTTRTWLTAPSAPHEVPVRAASAVMRARFSSSGIGDSKSPALRAAARLEARHSPVR